MSSIQHHRETSDNAPRYTLDIQRYASKPSILMANDISRYISRITGVGCDEDVSYSENVMVKGLSDSEIQQEVLADGEDKSLDKTMKYVEAKEAGKRSVGQLGEAGLSSLQLYKLTLHKATQQDKMLGQSENR